MSKVSLSSIESLLAQMRQVADSAAGISNNNIKTQDSNSTNSFAAELSRTIQRVSDGQQGALDQVQAYQAGVPGISLNDVMIDLQVASMSFQTSLQIRNKFISAYQEIASMPV